MYVLRKALGEGLGWGCMSMIYLPYFLGGGEFMVCFDEMRLCVQCLLSLCEVFVMGSVLYSRGEVRWVGLRSFRVLQLQW